MNEDKVKNNRVMSTIAIIITSGVVFATLFIAVVSLIKGYKEGSDSLIEHVGNITKTLLPVWGTWVGTVLAFYFSKENLDAAAKTNANLLNKLSEHDQNLAKKPVVSEMIPFAKIKYLCIEEDGDKSLSEIIINKSSRFPIFDNKKDMQLKFVIHSSLLFEQFYSSGKEKEKITLSELVEEIKKHKNLDETAAYIPVTATLLDAKNEMIKRDFCGDVFVTKDGKQTSEIIGWVTDTLIYKIEKD
jgi:hypothetical protein